METQHRVEIEADVPLALEAVADAAEMWGGDWERQGEGGRLTIPVSAGVRHGHVSGQISTRPQGRVSEVVLHVESVHYQLHWPSLAVLLFGAVGGLLIVVAPFFPPLFPLVPAGVILSLAAWFLVVARMKSRGSPEFLAFVGELVAAEQGPSSGNE